MDDGDFAWLDQWRWHLHSASESYASRKESNGAGRHNVFMHRQILGLAPGDPRQGEHKNRNRLDCRRSNLRIAERGDADNNQNQGLRSDNTSGYRGVSWVKRGRKWRAMARSDGGNLYLGSFDTPEEADSAVKAWRAEHMPFSEDATFVAS